MKPLTRLIRHADWRGAIIAVLAATALIVPSGTLQATEDDGTAVRPFRINVREADLADLRRRIRATRWPDKETVADRLATRGHDLVLVARDENRLNAVASRISEDTSRSVEVIAADLTNDADLVRVEQVLRTDASIEILVNNAGIVLGGDVANADPGRLESMIRLNVLAPTRLAAAIVGQFAARGHGTLINIGSALALAPEWANGAYSGTKAYVLNLSVKLQQELAGTGVRVQVVLPGAIRTAMWEKGGIDITSALRPEMLMDPGAMVDAALAGLDSGESVTIPSLPDSSDWAAYEAARRNMLPNLSRNTPAPRYGAVAANAV
jgi:uncharacterized protein